MKKEMLWGCNYFRVANIFNGIFCKSFKKGEEKKTHRFHTNWNTACLRTEGHIRNLTVQVLMVTKQGRGRTRGRGRERERSVNGVGEGGRGREEEWERNWEERGEEG